MHHMTLAEIARGLADKKFSSEELTKTLLARITALDPKVNSFISLTEELALSQAKAFYLVGSDYIWPRTSMKIARKHIENVLHGSVVGEDYYPLG
ncbi:transporter substrate-binding protein, partial [Pseudomonas sp. TNT11]